MRLDAALRSGERIIASKSPLEHAASLLLAIDSQIIIVLHVVLVGDVDGLVGTLLVDLGNVLLPLFHQHPPHVPHVPQFRALLDLVGDLRVLREDLLLQERLGLGVGTDFVDGHVDELGLLVEANVVIANERVFLLSLIHI